MPTTEADPSGVAGSGPVLDTARLRLRPLRIADAEAVATLSGDWAVAQYTARIPHPYSTAAAASWISANDEANETALAIERRSDGSFIGCCGYSPDEPGTVEIGYWIGRPFWRQGYGSEAVAAVIAHCFADPAVGQVIATVHPENIASIRLQERLGMVPAGTRALDMPARGYEIVAPLRVVTRDRWNARLAAGSAGCWREEPAHAPLPVVLVAAVALVDVDGRVLIQRRPAGKPMAGLWEFPGGKLHEGETPEAALVRELKEELAIDVTESCLAPLTFSSHR